MKRMLALGTLLAVVTLPGLAQDKKSQLAKEALKELNDFIGQWNGSGAPAKPKPAAGELWSETINWSWRFKGDDAWMEMTVKDGKHFQGGELRYLPDKKRYQLTATAKDGKKLVFEGDYKDGYLRLERSDPAKKETQRITMNTAAEGIRFILLFERKPEGRTLYVRDFQVACNREGESLATAKRKNECVVSGGLGTIAVSFKGETFYVCCTGCRDAFNENPQKYIDEYRARKGKK
ncbi:MAG TPA: hypothetical protein VNK04_03745 [Gemmataceae bacterium]|nr:hypothetical protein [Gemmataceae bacterium]